jgi:hypothetical protein
VKLFCAPSHEDVQENSDRAILTQLLGGGRLLGSRSGRFILGERPFSVSSGQRVGWAHS